MLTSWECSAIRSREVGSLDFQGLRCSTSVVFCDLRWRTSPHISAIARKTGRCRRDDCFVAGPNQKRTLKKGAFRLSRSWNVSCVFSPVPVRDELKTGGKQEVICDRFSKRLHQAKPHSSSGPCCGSRFWRSCAARRARRHWKPVRFEG